MNSIVEAG